MKRKLALSLAALSALAAVAALAAIATPAVAKANAKPDQVTVWNRTMVNALETAQTPPPPAMRIGAIVQSSVFDALNGIERKYTPIHVQPAAPPGASRKAAVVEAAYEALVNLFPAQKATFDTQLAASLADIGGGPNDQSVQRGLAWGKQVADQILAWRAGDGISAILPPYVASGLIGRWAPTPPTFGPPLFREFANMTPWAMTTPSQFLPGPPPALTSAALHEGLRRDEGDGERDELDPYRLPDPNRRVLRHRYTGGDLEPRRRRSCRVQPPDVVRKRPSAREDERRAGRCRHLDLERQEPLRHLASDHRDPAGGIRRKPRHHGRPELGASAPHTSVPGVPGRPPRSEQRRPVGARTVLRRTTRPSQPPPPVCRA